MLCMDNPALCTGMGLTRPKSGAATSEGSHRRNRLFLVDDDAAFRQIVKDALEDKGLSVTDFSNGEAMLDRLGDGADADVVILDWSLEKINGIELLQAMRERGIDLPVVFLTGRSTPIHSRVCLAFQTRDGRFHRKIAGYQPFGGSVASLRREQSGGWNE